MQPCTHMLVSHNPHPHDITVLGDESSNSTSAARLATLYYPDRVRNGAIVIPTSSVHRSPEMETSSQEETASTLRKTSMDRRVLCGYGSEIKKNSHWMIIVVSESPATRTTHQLCRPRRVAPKQVAVALKTDTTSSTGTKQRHAFEIL